MGDQRFAERFLLDRPWRSAHVERHAGGLQEPHQEVIVQARGKHPIPIELVLSQEGADLLGLGLYRTRAEAKMLPDLARRDMRRCVGSKRKFTTPTACRMPDPQARIWPCASGDGHLRHSVAVS